MSRIDRCSALITGASAGIGREFARQLAGRAASIVLVARRRERLEELREELTRSNPNLKVHIRETDLSDASSLKPLFDSLEAQNITIDFLINNAGLGDQGSFASSDPTRINEMLAVNMTALTSLTRLFLPGMIARKHGAILNVSSCAGFLPIAGLAVYAATKAYVTSFSEAIRTETHGTGVIVTALCPGPVDTEFATVARRTSTAHHRSTPRITHVSAEHVVQVGLAAIEHNKALVIPGFFMKCAMLLVRLTPAPILRLGSRFSAKQ
jgi:short-subunit dehydrogenase